MWRIYSNPDPDGEENNSSDPTLVPKTCVKDGAGGQGDVVPKEV
jgi:hypothetical protein